MKWVWRVLNWVLGKVSDLVLWLALRVACGSLAFAILVRGWSTFVDKKPSLDSFDPVKRSAAAKAAGEEYGAKP